MAVNIKGRILPSGKVAAGSGSVPVESEVRVITVGEGDVSYLQPLRGYRDNYTYPRGSIDNDNIRGDYVRHIQCCFDSRSTELQHEIAITFKTAFDFTKLYSFETEGFVFLVEENDGLYPWNGTRSAMSWNLPDDTLYNRWGPAGSQREVIFNFYP